MKCRQVSGLVCYYPDYLYKIYYFHILLFDVRKNEFGISLNRAVEPTNFPACVSVCRQD